MTPAVNLLENKKILPSSLEHDANVHNFGDEAVEN